MTPMRPVTPTFAAVLLCWFATTAVGQPADDETLPSDVEQDRDERPIEADADTTVRSTAPELFDLDFAARAGGISLNGAVLFMDMSELNVLLTDNEYGELSSTFLLWGTSAWYGVDGIMVGLEFLDLVSNSAAGDTRSVSANGRVGLGAIGYYLTWGAWGLIPMVGVGFQDLEVNLVAGRPDFGEGLDTLTSNGTLSHFAWGLTPGLEASYAIDVSPHDPEVMTAIRFGLRTSYTAAFLDAGWSFGGVPVDGGPDTTLNGFQIGISIGLFVYNRSFFRDD